MTVIEGKREQLVGKIQERYGYAKDQAEKEVVDWENATNTAGKQRSLHNPQMC